MAMTKMTIRIDEDVKAEAAKIAAAMGLTLSGVIALTFRQMMHDEALPFLPTAAGIRSEQRQGTGKPNASKPEAANYRDGYDTSRWMDVERVKSLSGDDMFDPVLGRQAFWMAKRQWEQNRVDPAVTLREYGFSILQLVPLPKPDPYLA